MHPQPIFVCTIADAPQDLEVLRMNYQGGFIDGSRGFGIVRKAQLAHLPSVLRNLYLLGYTHGKTNPTGVEGGPGRRPSYPPPEYPYSLGISEGCVYLFERVGGGGVGA